MSERAPETARTCCGRCGVYRDLHPTRTCEKSRRSFWWDEHYLWRHVAAWLWLRLNDRQRMNLVHRYWSHHKHLCWCEFVDAALLDDKRDDYADDLCDVPLPFGVGLPRPGWCYCSPDNAPTTPPEAERP